MVSVRDRGFRFGDGVFETIRVAGGSLYQWNLHCQRLKEGLRALHIPLEIDQLEGKALELLKKNGFTEGFLRIAISRGQGSVGYLPAIDGAPTLVMETVAPAPRIETPVSLWLSQYRKIPGQCLPAGVKTMQGLQSTLARMEAKENSCFEALLLDMHGHICEGSSGNIFWRVGETLYTPSLTTGALPGTMRAAVIRLSPYPVIQGEFTLDVLAQAEEVFLTNVAWVVVPVVRLLPVNDEWQEHLLADVLYEKVMEDMLQRLRGN